MSTTRSRIPGVRTRPMERGARLVRGISLLLAAACLVLFGASCGRSPRAEASPDGRVSIQYWELWTGFEAEAMREVVEAFNRSQDRITVHYLSVSQLDQKLLLATSGGNPPDLSGLQDSMVPVYAEKGALMPLDRLMKRDGITLDSYLPVVAEFCRVKGFTWALPTSPSSLGLLYNRTLFREAGLDPDRPPRTIAELDQYAEKLTKRDAKGQILQLGFSPSDPGWWNPIWCAWFGGEMVIDGQSVGTHTPESLRAFEWVQSYPKKYGLKNLDTFKASAGEFASAQNLFISGKVAMQMQGVYMHNFVSKYNPDLDYGVAPFPAETEALGEVTLVDANTLVIPRGSRHPEEAWEFIKFVQRQDVMEKLCLGHRKFSPLKKTSEQFYVDHSNPHIRLFRRLAESPSATTWPRLEMLNEYLDEMNAAYDEVWLMRRTPKDAMDRAAARLQPRLDRMRARWERVKDARTKEWSEQ